MWWWWSARAAGKSLFHGSWRTQHGYNRRFLSKDGLHHHKQCYQLQNKCCERSIENHNEQHFVASETTVLVFVAQWVTFSCNHGWALIHVRFTYLCHEGDWSPQYGEHALNKVRCPFILSRISGLWKALLEYPVWLIYLNPTCVCGMLPCHNDPWSNAVVIIIPRLLSFFFSGC